MTKIKPLHKCKKHKEGYCDICKKFVTLKFDILEKEYICTECNNYIDKDYIITVFEA